MQRSTSTIFINALPPPYISYLRLYIINVADNGRHSCRNTKESEERDMDETEFEYGDREYNDTLLRVEEEEDKE